MGKFQREAIIDHLLRLIENGQVRRDLVIAICLGYLSEVEVKDLMDKIIEAE